MVKRRKSGTTLVGIKNANGVAIFSDTRSTVGSIVALSECKKIIKITDYIYASGAGTSGDIEMLVEACARDVSMFEKMYNTRAYVSLAARNILKNARSLRGDVSADIILGGVDDNGLHLVKVISSDDMYKTHRYCAAGSGEVFAMSVLDDKYSESMSCEDAINLGLDAVEAGIRNDIYSGSKIDCVVIDGDGAKFTSAKRVVADERKEGRIISDLDVKILSSSRVII